MNRHTAPTRPILRYYGSKWKIAPWIISHLPAHVCYVEPYGGGAAVLLRKPAAFIEVYNDLYKQLVLFFKVLRERPTDLIHALSLTPHSRAEFVQSMEPVTDTSTPEGELEAARRFWVWAWQGRGRPGLREPSSFRIHKQQNRGRPVTIELNDLRHVWAASARLKLVTIECQDALKVIKRYDTPGALFYVDPPYVQSTLPDRRSLYKHKYTNEEHRALAQVLHDAQGMIVLSGFYGPLYEELYPGWPSVSRKAQNHAGRTVNTEVLWFNPSAHAALEKGQTNEQNHSSKRSQTRVRSRR